MFIGSCHALSVGGTRKLIAAGGSHRIQLAHKHLRCRACGSSQGCLEDEQLSDTAQRARPNWKLQRPGDPPIFCHTFLYAEQYDTYQSLEVLFTAEDFDFKLINARQRPFANVFPTFLIASVLPRRLQRAVAHRPFTLHERGAENDI